MSAAAPTSIVSGERPGLREGVAGRRKRAGHLILLSIKMSCFKPRRIQAAAGWNWVGSIQPVINQCRITLIG